MSILQKLKGMMFCNQNSHDLKKTRILVKPADNRIRLHSREFRGQIPQFVYRIDGRSPETIRKDGGIKPWDPNNDHQVSIVEHVTRNPNTNRKNKFDIAKSSHFVSTSDWEAYKNIKQSDGSITAILPILARKTKTIDNISVTTHGYVYKIATRRAPNGGDNFKYVNDVFDRNNQSNNFKGQLEWIHSGTIPIDAIEGYMHGPPMLQRIAFSNQTIVSAGEPHEYEWHQL